MLPTSLERDIARLRLALMIATTGCIVASTVALIVALRPPREIHIGNVHIEPTGIRVVDEDSFVSVNAKALAVGRYSDDTERDVTEITPAFLKLYDRHRQNAPNVWLTRESLTLANSDNHSVLWPGRLTVEDTGFHRDYAATP
jgi:hypothetical protein